MSKIAKCLPLSVFLMFGQIHFAACADTARTNEHEQSPVSGLKDERPTIETPGQKRDPILLSEPEIRKGLIGQRLIVDRGEPNIPFAEDFLPDGSWIISRPERAVITEHGVWRVHNGQICARVTQSPFGVKGRRDVCRQVWRDRSSGKIAMIDEQSTRRDVLVFSSSPLK